MSDQQQSFTDAAQSLLQEMQEYNDEFDATIEKASREVDGSLAAVDDALEQFAQELEKGEESTVDDSSR